MAMENGIAVFSLRLPAALAKQIDDRCKLNRRPRNSEIILLLEQAIDLGVQRDKQMLEASRTKAPES